MRIVGYGLSECEPAAGTGYRMAPAIALSRAAAAQLEVKVLTEGAQLEAIGKEWDELLDESDQRVYFLRWAWNNLWWRTYAPPGSRLHVVTCRDEQGMLVGIAPFYLRRRGAARSYIRDLMFLGTGINIQLGEYLDIIARRGYERRVASAVAESLRDGGEWDRLWLTEVPDSSQMLALFRQALGGAARVEVCNRTHYIDTQGDWQTFKAGLGKHTRRNLGVYTRRLLERYDAVFARVERSEQIGPAIDALVRLHQARWELKGEPGSFSIPHFKGFLRAAVESGLDQGRLRMWTLTIDGRIAAVEIGFFDNGVIHAFHTTFDIAYAKDSIGTVMLGHVAEYCLEDPGVRELDFMGGEEAYKKLWTGLRRENVTLELLRPTARARAYEASRRALRGSKRLLKATMPAPVLNVLRHLMRSLRLI